MSCWRSFGAAEFLDRCLRRLIVLFAYIWCRWLFVLDRCWRQCGAFSGYYTPQRSHLKIAVLPQCEAFSADFAGRRSICALRRAKITEGERVVPPVVALTRQVSVHKPWHAQYFKRKHGHPQLKPCRGSCEVATFVCQILATG